MRKRLFWGQLIIFARLWVTALMVLRVRAVFFWSLDLGLRVTPRVTPTAAAAIEPAMMPDAIFIFFSVILLYSHIVILVWVVFAFENKNILCFLNKGENKGKEKVCSDNKI